MIAEKSQGGEHESDVAYRDGSLSASAGCLWLQSSNLILGRWEVENAPTKMAAEFKSDGTATISILGHTVQGTYKLNGTDELEWSMNGMSTKAKMKVTATDLELTDNANRTIKYKRK